MSEKDVKPKVLISAAASPAAVSLVRHLREKGFYIIGMDANPDAAPMGASVCDEFIMSPMATDSRYVKFLSDRLSDCDVFLPFIDEELSSIVDNFSSIDNRHKIMLSDCDSIKVCLDKISFQDFCIAHSINVAPTANSVPAIYKPRHGRGGKGVLVIEDDAIFNIIRNKNTGVIQKFLKGVEYTVDCLFDRDSNLLSAVARKRLLASGVSTIGRIDQHPDVLDMVDKLRHNFMFRGLINVQIMMTDEGPFLIEINPRLSGSLMFTVMAGADLADAAVRLWLNDDKPGEFTLKEKTFCRYWSEYEY